MTTKKLLCDAESPDYINSNLDVYFNNQIYLPNFKLTDFWKKGKTGSQILKELTESLGKNCPSKHMVYKWIDRFESDWDDFNDTPHGSRPKSSKTDTNIELKNFG